MLTDCMAIHSEKRKYRLVEHIILVSKTNKSFLNSKLIAEAYGLRIRSTVRYSVKQQSILK